MRLAGLLWRLSEITVKAAAAIAVVCMCGQLEALFRITFLG